MNDAVNQRAGKGRDLQLSNAKKALNTLLLKDKSHAEEYKKIINKLNEKKIKDSNSSDVKESVNSLITKLQNIKK